MSFDQVEMSSDRGCFGRVYFKVPGGTKHGGYVLNIQFEKALLHVPFKLRTEEEQKACRQKLKELRDERKKRTADRTSVLIFVFPLSLFLKFIRISLASLMKSAELCSVL